MDAALLQGLRLLIAVFRADLDLLERRELLDRGQRLSDDPAIRRAANLTA